jgi:hypothetical protein
MDINSRILVMLAFCFLGLVLTVISIFGENIKLKLIAGLIGINMIMICFFVLGILAERTGLIVP